MNLEEQMFLYFTIITLIYFLIQYIIRERLIYLRLYKELKGKKTAKCIFSFKDYFEFSNKIVFKANHPQYKKGDVFTSAVWIMYLAALYNLFDKNHMFVVFFISLGILVSFFRTQRIIIYDLESEIEIYDFALINKKTHIRHIIKNGEMILEKYLRNPKLYEIRIRGNTGIYLISIILSNNKKLEITFYRHRYKKNKSKKTSKKLSKAFDLSFSDMSDESKEL